MIDQFEYVMTFNPAFIEEVCREHAQGRHTTRSAACPHCLLEH